MTQLTFLLRGYEFEIVCGRFPKSVFEPLERFRRENRLSLKEIFYLNDELIREKGPDLQWRDWRSLGSIYHGRSIELNAVTLKNVVVSLDGQPVEMDVDRICRLREEPLRPPVAKEGFLAVTGGAIHICRIAYEIDITDHRPATTAPSPGTGASTGDLDLRKLAFVLKDYSCLGLETDHLVRIEYDGIPMTPRVVERKTRGMMDVAVDLNFSSTAGT
jgi:hypothetical protein